MTPPNNPETEEEKVKKLVLIVCLVLLFYGCADVKKNWRHTVSATTGLTRTVTLFANDGHIIKQWTGKFLVEDEGSVVSFIDNDNLEVKMTGTVLIEQTN